MAVESGKVALTGAGILPSRTYPDSEPQGTRGSVREGALEDGVLCPSNYRYETRAGGRIGLKGKERVIFCSLPSKGMSKSATFFFFFARRLHAKSLVEEYTLSAVV